MRSSEAKKEFMKIMRQFHRHQPWRVFSDFCEMSALSLLNVLPRCEQIEQQYLKVAGGYEKEEIEYFPKLLSLVVEALEHEYRDFLGEVFQDLELSNHWKGQYFTPFDVCKAIARMNLDFMKETIESKGFVTVMEPACGAGAMIIGLCEALYDAEINYQEHVHVFAVDVDPTAAYMCYIQLTLLHVPAIVYVGNSLSLEMRKELPTFAHHCGFWGNKIRRGHLLGYEPDSDDRPEIETIKRTELPIKADVILEPVQLDLFKEETA